MTTILSSISIVSSPDILDGKPRLEGHRIGVHQIVYHVLYQGWNYQELEEAYGLPPADVHAALSYYYGHVEEIESLIERNLDDDSPPRIRELAALLDSFLSTGQAAQRLQITERAVRKLIDSGTLPAKKVGANWFIHPDDLNRPEVKNRKPGRPPRQ